MEFNPFDTQSWNRAFSIWISDIQVCFSEPVRDMGRLRGGFLRWVRGGTRLGAGLVALFFSLHCTQPRVPLAVVPAPTPLEGAGASSGYSETGQASWYGGEEDAFAGRPTATGEAFDPEALTCAHRTLPLGTYVEVVNLANGHRTVLRVNDRGPFVRGRILDVSQRAARELGFHGRGTVGVRIRSVSQDGSLAAVRQDQDDPFTVQVGSFSDEANVDRLVRELRRHFQEVTVQAAMLGNGSRVKRVRVGSYQHQDEAARAAEDIAKKLGHRGVEPFITRRGRQG